MTSSALSVNDLMMWESDIMNGVIFVTLIFNGLVVLIRCVCFLMFILICINIFSYFSISSRTRLK